MVGAFLSATQLRAGALFFHRAIVRRHAFAACLFRTDRDCEPRVGWYKSSEGSRVGWLRGSDFSVQFHGDNCSSLLIGVSAILARTSAS